MSGHETIGGDADAKFCVSFGQNGFERDVVRRGLKQWESTHPTVQDVVSKITGSKSRAAWRVEDLLIAREFPTWQGGGVSWAPSVCCSPGALMVVDATPSTGSCGVQDEYHLVWVTQYRRKILVPGIADDLKKVRRAVREFHPD